MNTADKLNRCLKVNFLASLPYDVSLWCDADNRKQDCQPGYKEPTIEALIIQYELQLAYDKLLVLTK